MTSPIGRGRSLSARSLHVVQRHGRHEVDRALPSDPIDVPAEIRHQICRQGAALRGLAGVGQHFRGQGAAAARFLRIESDGRR